VVNTDPFYTAATACWHQSIFDDASMVGDDGKGVEGYFRVLIGRSQQPSVLRAQGQRRSETCVVGSRSRRDGQGQAEGCLPLWRRMSPASGQLFGGQIGLRPAMANIIAGARAAHPVRPQELLAASPSIPCADPLVESKLHLA
jgi:hypothetical protein